MKYKQKSCRIPAVCLKSNTHWLVSTPCATLPEGALEGKLRFDSSVLTLDEAGDESLTLVEWYQIPNGNERVSQQIGRWHGLTNKLVKKKMMFFFGTG